MAPQTSKFSTSAPPWETTQKMDSVHFEGVGVRIWRLCYRRFVEQLLAWVSQWCPDMRRAPRTIKTILKPLCRLPPSQAKTLQLSAKISQTKNAAWSCPTYPLLRDILVLGHFCFLSCLGGCGSQGLYNRSKPLSQRSHWVREHDMKDEICWQLSLGYVAKYLTQ